MKDLTVVQLQLGWLTSLSEWLDGTLPNLHHVVQLGHVLRQILGHHARVDRLVGGLVVDGEGAPQAAVVGTVVAHHGEVVADRGMLEVRGLAQTDRVFLLHTQVGLQLDLLVGRLRGQQLVHQVRLVLPGEMSVHVKLQFVLPSKALPAPLAGEGSLPGVGPDVPVEVGHPGELGLTVGAGIGTDTVVDLERDLTFSSTF